MGEAFVVAAVPSSFGPPAYSESLPRTGESAAVARRFVRTVLETWHLPELADCAVLVVAELVANAAEHARGSCIRVTVTRSGERRVRVAVVDKDRTQPQMRAPTLREDSGRGLLLVDAVSDGWGVDPLRWGKRVWADVCVRH